MTVTAAFVLYVVIWFMVFFVVLPLRLTTQGDAGTTLPGTHAGAPEDIGLGGLGRKALITTGVAALLFAAVASVILWGPWGVRDLDWFGRMGPPSAPPGG